MLYLGMAVLAALAFTVGGVFMKLSQGFSQPLPSLIVLALFGIGAALTALAIHARGELGPAYLIVLGLEAVLAFLFGPRCSASTRTWAGSLVSRSWSAGWSCSRAARRRRKIRSDRKGPSARVSCELERTSRSRPDRSP